MAIWPTRTLSICPCIHLSFILFICPVLIHSSVISLSIVVIYLCIHVSVIYISIIHYLSVNHRFSSSQPAIYHLSISKFFLPSISLTVAYYLPTYLSIYQASIHLIPISHLSLLSFQSPIHHISAIFPPAHPIFHSSIICHLASYQLFLISHLSVCLFICPSILY